MEFILMVVVFAAVFLFLPRILKKPIVSDGNPSHTQEPISTEAVCTKDTPPPQTTSDSLEKQ